MSVQCGRAIKKKWCVMSRIPSIGHILLTMGQAERGVRAVAGTAEEWDQTLLHLC